MHVLSLISSEIITYKFGKLQILKCFPLNLKPFSLKPCFKVIGSDIHTSVNDNRDDFRFPIINFPWLSGDVPIPIVWYLHFAVCYRKNVDLLDVVLEFGLPF